MKILNLSYLEELSGGSTEFIQEMLDMYLEQIPKEVELLKASFEENNIEEVTRVAHKIKPSMGFIGWEEGLQWLQSIENEGKNVGKSALLEESYYHFCSKIDTLVAELQAEKLRLLA